jgi:predicted aspartyl protease
MLLTLSDGTPFATGASGYLDTSGGSEATSRIWLNVSFLDQDTKAIVDTGAPYAVCSPDLAAIIGLTPNHDDPRIQLGVRGTVYDGHLVRLELTIHATEGEDITIQATAFVPESSSTDVWHHPSFLGLTALERLRFAVDPVENIFYFGPAND